MKLCPVCGMEYPDSEQYCGRDGTTLVEKITTNPIVVGGPKPAIPKKKTATHPDLDLDLTADSSILEGPIEGIESGTVLGSYRLIKQVGEGGMGEVYLAEHIKLGRKVAIKILRPEFAGNQSTIDRFFNEARAVNQIAHQNIVEITDFFEQADGQNFYVMEFLEGVSLQDLVFETGPISPGRIIHIGIQVADALAAVHAQNIVHRDLKPENIFLIQRGDEKDFVKLLDFGVAKLLDPAMGMSLHKTQTGVIMGTPEYMAPEQFKRLPIDGRTDIYALGLILFEMATGHRPWNFDSIGDLVVAHMTKIPPRVNKVKSVKHPINTSLEKLITCCLEKKAEDRPQTMKEISYELRRIIGAPTQSHGEEIFAKSVIRAEQKGVLKKKTPTLLTGGLNEKDFLSKLRKRSLYRAAGLSAFILLVGVAGWKITQDNTPVAPQKETSTQASSNGQKESPRNTTPSTTITIQFGSEPEGAEVRRKGQERVLGITPFTLALAKNSMPGTFEFTKDGYKIVVQEISLSQNSSALVSLAPETKKKTPQKVFPPPSSARDWIKKSPKKPAPAKKSGGNGLIDPFSK